VEAIAKYLVLPSSLMTISLLAGLVLLLFRRTKRGLWVGLGGVVIYLVFGAGPVSFLLLGALEFRIPPVDLSERERSETIVVLAGYGESDPDHPLSSRVNGTSAIRLLETVMLYKSRPTATVFVSGFDDVARIMRDIIVSAGVPDDQVITDVASKNTYESAVHLAPMLGNKPFLLVTSAGHMPRAMGVFLKAGTHPLPVPTDYMTKRNPLATNYLPSPVHLYYADLAISEYAALAWYYLKGRV
jgi:uncharacterized SAM-binding protein YcdF (DUF218 family)